MDARELACLLNASFRCWGVTARAEPLDGAHLAARIAAPGLGSLCVQHVQGEGVPARWRCVVQDAAGEDSCEPVSIGSLLKALRLYLDPEFLPGRAIIGIRPASRSAPIDWP